MKFKEWFRFFIFGYFSDKIADKARLHGFTAVFVAVIITAICFFAGFYAADVVPFSTHLKNSETYLSFIDSAFSANGAGLEIKNHIAFSTEKINTYTDEKDKELFSVGGYELIVDTRPSDTLVEFTQTAIKGDSEIPYEEYLTLTEEEKKGYSVLTKFTDKALVITEADTARRIDFLERISDSGQQDYDKNASAEYNSLKSAAESYTDADYGKEIYFLYVKYYFNDAKSYLNGAKAPVLCDYYYVNYLANGVSQYLYVFDGLLTGSFKTERGVPVVFGGYYDACADGEVTDMSALITDIFYSSAGEAFFTYFISTLSQLPFLVIIPMLIALLLRIVAGIMGIAQLKNYTVCYKTVNLFVWFSAFLTALITFVCAFFFASRALYNFMPLIFALLLIARTTIYNVSRYLKFKRESAAEGNEASA